MDNEQMIEVIQAHKDGKAIQVKWCNQDNYHDDHSNCFNFVEAEYRVKPDPKYHRVKVLNNHTLPVFCSDGNFASIGALKDALNIIDARCLNIDDIPTYEKLSRLVEGES